VLPTVKQPQAVTLSWWKLGGINVGGQIVQWGNFGGGLSRGNVQQECPDLHAGLQVSTCSVYDLSPWFTHTQTDSFWPAVLLAQPA